MRARNIKPGFFHNEDLSDTPFEARLLFIGLWLLADREGRLEDRPRKIKMQVFPADDVDVEQLLCILHKKAQIIRYEHMGKHYICIPQWHKHQHPHHQEKQSVIPEPGDGANQSSNFKINPSDTRILNPEGPRAVRKAVASRFQEWWDIYPQKRNKKRALSLWKSKNLDEKADLLIEDTRRRMRSDEQWKKGFIPYPSTYLNGERWEDELTMAPSRPPAEKRITVVKEETAEERKANHEKAMRQMKELAARSAGKQI